VRPWKPMRRLGAYAVSACAWCQLPSAPCGGNYRGASARASNSARS
jgi:hypothetical protein